MYIPIEIYTTQCVGPPSICCPSFLVMGFPGGTGGKESACQCRRCGFHPWVRKIPCSRKWQSTPVFLPGKSHGQRNLAGLKDLNMTEWLRMHAFVILLSILADKWNLSFIQIYIYMCIYSKDWWQIIVSFLLICYSSPFCLCYFNFLSKLWIWVYLNTSF